MVLLFLRFFVWGACVAICCDIECSAQDPNVKALFDVFIDAWFEQAAEGEESEEDVNDDPVEPDSGLAIVEDSGDEVH